MKVNTSLCMGVANQREEVDTVIFIPRFTWLPLLVFLNAYRNNPQAHRITVVVFHPEVFKVSYFNGEQRYSSRYFVQGQHKGRVGRG